MRFVIDSSGGDPRLVPENLPPIQAAAPAKVEKYLWDRGWVEGLDNKWNHPAEESGLTWEQAMAVEFLNFLMLGRENDAQGS